MAVKYCGSSGSLVLVGQLIKFIKSVSSLVLKKEVTTIVCVFHRKAPTKNDNILTTDASAKGLGATLWQKTKRRKLEFASRFLSNTEKKYAINELEVLAVVCGLEHFRLYIYGKPIELLTDHQALEPLIKRNRSNKT